MTKKITNVVGLKVKVHMADNKSSVFGEALGYTEDNLLIVHKRSTFADLSIGAFDLFRTYKEVVFVNDHDEMKVTIAGEVHEVMPKKVEKKQRLIRYMISKHKEDLKDGFGNTEQILNAIKKLEEQLKP